MEKTFIPNDPEQILSETIAHYQALSGEKLNPADVERVLIDCLAYRETLLRGEVDHCMRQNFVQYAEGAHLDNWGELFGVPRLNGETDNDYRKRVLEGNHFSVGTLGAYRNCILSVPGVSDVWIERKSDDNTLPPGVIRLTPIMSVRSSDMVLQGTPHNDALETAINESVYTENFGVIGAKFEYQKAVPVPLSGTIAARSILEQNAQQLEVAIRAKASQYFADLSLKFDRNFNIYDLERAIEGVEGILSLDAVQFDNVPTKNFREFYTQGTITINIT